MVEVRNGFADIYSLGPGRHNFLFIRVFDKQRISAGVIPNDISQRFYVM